MNTEPWVKQARSTRRITAQFLYVGNTNAPYFTRMHNKYALAGMVGRLVAPWFVMRYFNRTTWSSSPASRPHQVGPWAEQWGYRDGTGRFPPESLTWNSSSCLCRASCSTWALSKVFLSSLSSNSLTGRKGERRPSLPVLSIKNLPFSLNCTSQQATAGTLTYTGHPQNPF